MKPAAATAFAVLIAVSFAALAGCESDDDDLPPPVPPSPFVQANGDYARETGTGDLSVRVLIPAAIRTLPGAGERVTADVEAEIATVERRAAERRRERPDGFLPSELVIFWSASYQDADVVSMLGQTQLFEGGFGRTEARSTLVYDRVAGREVGFADLFVDPSANGAAMTAVSEAAFQAWAEASPSVRGRSLALVDERTLIDARESLRPRAASFASFVLVPAQATSGIAGVNLLYPDGRLGPASDGPFTLFVPAEALAPHLKPEWVAKLAR
jgi:hypothetical protein